MKREEKNQQTKHRIMESALKEFAEQGYGASSVNNICSCEGVSKGIITIISRPRMSCIWPVWMDVLGL